MKNIKNFPEFTHFLSIPFIRNQHRITLGEFQNEIQKIFKEYKLQNTLKRSNTNLMHITLSMLTLNLENHRIKSKNILQKLQKQIFQILNNSIITLNDIKYFTRYNRNDKKKYVSLFYLDFNMNENIAKIQKAADLIIKELVKQQIISHDELKSMHLKYDHKSGMYKNQQFHMTLFRIDGLEENQLFNEAYQRIQQIIKVKQQKQIEKLELCCDYLDISTRNNYDKTNFYKPLARVQIGFNKNQINLQQKELNLQKKYKKKQKAKKNNQV